MRVVIQRVLEAFVTVDNKMIGSIKEGLLVLLGIEDADLQEDIVWLGNKITNLRIFNDDEGLMNRSVLDIDGEILLVSQFTLFASTKKGNRPSFIQASKPAVAIPLYELMIVELERILNPNFAIEPILNKRSYFNACKMLWINQCNPLW